MPTPAAAFNQTASGYESAFQQPLGDVMASGGWQTLLADMGANMAESVRQALDGLGELARVRRIGSYEARWMREPLQQLYQSGIAAQRLSRLAARSLPAAQEPVPLNDVLAETVADHQQRWPSHQIQCELDPLDIMSEPESLASLADALVGWGCGLGGVLDLQLTHEPDKRRAVLTLRVDKLHRGNAGGLQLDSIEWLLLWQLARVEGVRVWRSVCADHVRVVMHFDRVMERHSGLAVLESSMDSLSASLDSDVTTVWCITASGTPAAGLVASITPHLPSARMIESVAAMAAELPHTPDCVVSTRDVLHTNSFRHWRQRAQELRGRSVAAVEITPEEGVFDIGDFGPDSMGRISAGALTPKLLGAVVSEMGRLTESMP